MTTNIKRHFIIYTGIRQLEAYIIHPEPLASIQFDELAYSVESGAGTRLATRQHTHAHTSSFTVRKRLLKLMNKLSLAIIEAARVAYPPGLFFLVLEKESRPEKRQFSLKQNVITCRSSRRAGSTDTLFPDRKTTSFHKNPPWRTFRNPSPVRIPPNQRSISDLPASSHFMLANAVHQCEAHIDWSWIVCV